jgi:cell wall-associated NlpC family hydrolase
VYASTNPKVGFDCSGFITYVFNHFGIAVPRSSVDFTGVGKTIPVPEAKRGDLILFTGTDSTERVVGHMGLVVANGDELEFIHSTSGKAMGVTITPLNAYYKKRFVRVARIFPQNDAVDKVAAR